MRKLFVIPLLFIYLLSVSGIVCYAHYCGQNLVSLNIYTEADGCEDGGCGDESDEPDDCCKDEVITAKTVQDQNSIEFFKLKLSSSPFDLPEPIIYNAEVHTLASVHHTSKVHRANAPPGLWELIPLYKLHSSYTYYG